MRQITGYCTLGSCWEECEERLVTLSDIGNERQFMWTCPRSHIFDRYEKKRRFYNFDLERTSLLALRYLWEENKCFE